ncbi:hypothetical protein DWF00_02825 [Bosea caraganae]|uniref:Membrane-associated oxidoreductase n=1 Tax=Bosea caraganae TaxID=2763117 RepID=A0A370L4S0_9HYPH|nr:hypothetical protein [Bosea caraganae]RDJ24046.1 hypothetical protein DWE98_14055 [Bosea caraganae]RDJ30088.1 hypothetical protein DWF00_02825 [Bosea caraganae]
MMTDWGVGAEAERAQWATATAHLDDFRPLLPAEEDVVAKLLSGSFDRLGDGSRPVEPDPARLVRARFLRFLLLGGEEGCRPHEKGIRISGAWITEVLDLEACRIFRDIGLNDCHFEAAPILRAAIINRLFLDGSLLPGLQAERLEARGGVYLRGAEINGEVNLVQSRLGGNLECDGASIRAPGGYALLAPSLEVRNVLLRGSNLRGGINLSGAQLAADFDCAGAVVTRADGVAIEASELEARGSVLLRSARIEGETRLTASRIGADMDCSGAVLDNPGEAALDMSRAVVEGAFFLRREAKINGMLTLTGASVGTIHDEASSWPKTGDLLLNRCRYGAFIDGPVDADSRLDWLARQMPERCGEDFWPQPYEQLAVVFREMGHGEDARAVLVVKERLQRKARRARAGNPLLRGLLTAADGVLGVTLAYGRQPLLAFVWLILFWFLGVVIFGYAEHRGAVMPNSAVVLRAPEWTLCGIDRSEHRSLFATQQTNGLAEPGQTQLDCFRRRWEASSYPAFSPWMYSLDTLLPVLDMGQRTFWRPNPSKPGGRIAINYFYFQSIVGWALSLLAVAGFSGLVKSP